VGESQGGLWAVDNCSQLPLGKMFIFDASGGLLLTSTQRDPLCVHSIPELFVPCFSMPVTTAKICIFMFI